MKKCATCLFMFVSNFVMSMDDYKNMDANSISPSKERIDLLSVNGAQTEDTDGKIIEEVVSRYNECDSIVGFIKELAEMHVGAVRYFPYIFDLLHNKFQKDVDTALTEIRGLFDVVGELNLNDSEMCQIYIKMLDAIAVEGPDISKIFDSLFAFKYVYGIDDYIRERLLESIKYINRGFTEEGGRIINLLFPFIASNEILFTKRLNKFNPCVFAFELLKEISRNLNQEVDILELGHYFLENFYCYEGDDVIFRYASRLIPDAIRTLVSQYKTVDQAVNIIIGLWKRDHELLDQYGEFMGFDPNLNLKEVAYDQDVLAIALLARGINRRGEVRHLFSVARKRLNEIAFCESEFEQFVASVFQNLLFVIGSRKCDAQLYAMLAVKVATSILNDKVTPSTITWNTDEEDIHDPLCEVLANITSDAPTKDEDVANDIENFISDRAAIPIYDYEVVGALLLRLKELNYSSCIQVFAGFYPFLNEVPYFLKEAFIETIAYQMFWLHQSFFKLKDLSADVIVEKARESDGRSDVFIDKLKEEIGEQQCK